MRCGSEKRRICTAVVRKYEEGAENRHPKVPETLILWALPELERAKGIEPSYEAWEALQAFETPAMLASAHS
jgi:hypothetical protein